MATLFRLLADDETTVLFDFMDSAGTTNPHGLKSRLRVDPNFSAPAGEHTLFQPPDQPGGSLAFTRDELVEMDWRLAVSASTQENLTRGIGEMARLLRAGKVLLWQPDGTSESRFIDYISVSIGALARGQDASSIFLNEVDAEFPIAVVRKPFMRGPELDSDTNKAKNSLFIHKGIGDPRPRDWNWNVILDITAESIDAATEAYKFDIATTGARNLFQLTPPASAAAGEVWTFYFYGFVNAGTNVRARAQLGYFDATNALIVNHQGELTVLGTSRPNMSITEEAISVTTPAAPVGTNRIEIAVRFENLDATQRTVRLIGAQLEKASVATKLVVTTETMTNEVEEDADGYPSVAPIFIHGDAPAPVSFRLDESPAVRSTSLVAFRSRGNVGDKRLADYLNDTNFAQCESAINVADTVNIDSTVEPGFSPGSGTVGKRTDFISTEAMNERLRFQLSTFFDSRKGTWDVWLRAKPSVGLSEEIKVQLKWALHTDPAGLATESAVVLPDTLVPHFFRIGRIFIPEDVPVAQLVLRLNASRAVGAENPHIRWDYITFIPVNEGMASYKTALAADRVLTLPEEGFIYTTDLNDDIRSLVSVNGPIPFFVSPGLAMVFRHLRKLGVDTDTDSESITVNRKMGHSYSPRYYN